MEIMPLRWMKWSRNRRFHVITHVLLTYFVVPTQISYFQKFEQNYVKAFQLFIYFEDCACEKLEGSPRLMPRIPQQKNYWTSGESGEKKQNKNKNNKTIQMLRKDYLRSVQFYVLDPRSTPWARTERKQEE